MKDLAEVMEKLEPVKELKEKLVDCFKAEVSNKGLECVDAEEAGKVADMIKDLAEAEKYCMETLYFQKVTEAMVTYEEPRYGESYGYNSNHFKSSGRFAPKGMGTRMGFMPQQMQYLDHYYGDYMEEPTRMSAMMGYSGGGSSNAGGMSGSGSSSGSSGNSSSSNSGSTSMGYREYQRPDSRHGQAYNDYAMARRHFTESRSMNDKQEMEMHAEEHVQDTLATIRDIWKDAEPNLKRRMKEDFTKLLQEMDV